MPASGRLTTVVMKPLEFPLQFAPLSGFMKPVIDVWL
jgi:hypothetical protein